MKLDPGIHIDMHSVLSLKPGVTSFYANEAGRLWTRSSTTLGEGCAGNSEGARHPLRLLRCACFDGISCVISNPESVVCYDGSTAPAIALYLVGRF